MAEMMSIDDIAEWIIFNQRIPRSSAAGWKMRKGLVWKGKRRVPFQYKTAF